MLCFYKGRGSSFNFFFTFVSFKKKKKDICVKAQPEVGRGHSQIIIMLMQGTPRVVSIVKVMVFVGTEIKGTK